MSRVYTIAVSEKVRRVVHLTDQVGTRVDWLEILPPEEMAGLLARELAARGFSVADGRALRVEPDGVAIEVELATGRVVLGIAHDRAYEAEGARTGRSERRDDVALAKRLDRELRTALEDSIARERDEDQTELTQALEKRLAEVQPELDRVGTEVTKAALVAKARRLGEVRSVEEDPSTGAVRITVGL